MKLYWPVALTCSVVGSMILAPVATGTGIDRCFQCLLPALVSGALMALTFRRFFLRAPWPVVLLMAPAMGGLHVALFGAIEDFILSGVNGLLIGFFEAMLLAVKVFWLSIPLFLGGNALIKYVVDKEVEDIQIFDL